MAKSKITVMFIPDKGKRFSFSFSPLNFKFALVSAFLMTTFIGYFSIDYLNLMTQRNHFQKIQKENKIIKGEAQLLTQNLEGVKKSLGRVQDYAQKVTEIVNIKINAVKVKTGIEPITKDDVKLTKENEGIEFADPIYPLGINVDKLTFKPVFSKLGEIHQESNQQALKLQHLLSSLSQKKSLLSSIPTMIPAKGWITSGFGKRISPFTGELTEHRGLDIAAAVGTPIFATADGVVIFSGTKPDFGNIVMIAHYENGIITKYGHNAENLVQAGQKISRGDVIAYIGQTGNVTGPHVHYEVLVDGQPENPEKFILNSDLSLVSFL